MVEALLSAVGLTTAQMPAINAALNGLAAILLVIGYGFIRARRVTAHKWCMISAFSVSALFLTSYLYYHLAIKGGEPTRFTSEGWPKTIYLSILISHTVLAAIIGVLAPVTLWLGFSAPNSRHVTLAKWTFPIWLYVSVTGVIVYFMLYHIFPPGG